MEINKAEKFILDLLQSKLPENLHYHKVSHTLDVVNSSTEIAIEENIVDPTDLILLRTAALYHDCGFINVYEDHEEEGCRITREILPMFSYNADQIEIICEMIMKTKIPQRPATHLEKILCDADLDHLGKEDFEIIGRQLISERRAHGFQGDENAWNEIQISFLESHTFWTESSRRKGNQKKSEHLMRLKNLYKV